MEIADAIVGYLKVLTSPQLVALAIVVFIVRRFPEQIANFINRLKKLEVPGAKFETESQVAKTLEDASAPDAAKLSGATVIHATPGNAVAAGVQANVTTTEQAAAPTPAAAPASPGADAATALQHAQDVATQAQTLALWWEFRFLNFFLARRTQEVLDWLAQSSSVTSIQLYDAYWQTTEPSPVERKAIFEALLNHHLISLSEHLISVTIKGREYLNWRGPLPAIPAPVTPVETKQVGMRGRTTSGA